jgi:hypothetical protein
VTQD